MLTTTVILAVFPPVTEVLPSADIVVASLFGATLEMRAVKLAGAGVAVAVLPEVFVTSNSCVSTFDCLPATVVTIAYV